MTISKPSIKNLFKDLLDEIKDFKYKITLNVFLTKCKENADEEFVPVCFNSTTKLLIRPKYDLNKSFQEVFTRIDNWISEGSGWIIKSVDAEFVSVSIYSPLSENSNNKLPDKLKKKFLKRCDQY